MGMGGGGGLAQSDDQTGRKDTPMQGLINRLSGLGARMNRWAPAEHPPPTPRFVNSLYTQCVLFLN